MKRIIISIFFISSIFASNLIFKEKQVPIVNDLIKVEIKGAISKPGVYQLKSNSRVQDLVDVSGGLNNNADISIINLSKKLEDEMVVIIYNKEEIKEMVKGNTSIKYIEKECICPMLENDGCFDNYITNEESIINDTGKISLNTATIEELLTLPGIGETKAKSIIKYREEVGSFKNIEEIMNIKGIGKSTFEKFKDYLTL
ncbi:MAG: helix-hairpin-helix domain-containing protein [Bacilli bacterium]|nr:helix-hairpin-helix domain-containing protein [Bacilli bacterium]MDD4608055.1 helix-hairpin-helix domain-containing protein [Bacilli bacterium]